MKGGEHQDTEVKVFFFFLILLAGKKKKRKPNKMFYICLYIHEPGPRGSGPAGRGCAKRGFLSVWWRRRPFCGASSLSRSGCGVGTWRGGETERGQPGPSPSPSLRLPARRSPPLRRCPRPRAELTHHYGRRRAAPDPLCRKPLQRCD